VLFVSSIVMDDIVSLFRQSYPDIIM